MNTFHLSGYPRVGAKRELKFAVEAFWKGAKSEAELRQTAADIRQKNWATQIAAGADLLPVGDFSYYDHVLDTLCALGAIPARFGFDADKLTLSQYFELARGNASQVAMEMTKWFDTNYHYIVPEWHQNTSFKANAASLIAQIEEAKATGHDIKPTLVGPLTLLWLGKEKDAGHNRLELLPRLLPEYQKLLRELANAGVDWIQIDEPILAVDIAREWLDAFAPTYQELAITGTRIIIGTYFGSVAEHINLLKNLPVNGVHIDCVRAPEQLAEFANAWPENKVLSVGLIDGRNVWRANLREVIELLAPVATQLGNNLWIAPSCSLLHSPQDLSVEEKLNPEIRNWLAFAAQKLQELGIIKQALAHGKDSVQEALAASDAAAAGRKTSKLIHNDKVAQRVASLREHADQRHSPFAQRIEKQQQWMNLPLLPTTTIGSFPQTQEIRQARAAFKKGELSAADYEAAMKKDIAYCVEQQEQLDIDVLVHGEAERNDMVEYFGEQLDGYCFTQYGWVQSYGSRCVKPPIIFGDVARPKAMTVAWSSYAQSLTKRPMKGMLTGPVTMMKWSFVRNDVPLSLVCKQIALALNDEVLDLEKAGIRVIQIDEPAIREALPLKRAQWDEYLAWACESFRLTSTDADDSTQIHTHMCYSEFNDILPAIASMDADVITIETSRSDMELLDAFVKFSYPNDIGPGVYDIHSPRVPTEAEVEHLLRKALKVIDQRRLWVNPDCGLKTRGWPETKAALEVMVNVTKKLRAELTA
ncbi:MULTISPECIES: 5-methyltetrahydropteroyltriglutamate--homocysteine S-methyltransferase [unclassified Snodgrassella]|uniref:5-methyltetrahydropteroyltriglutamate-- homocysteine S-methyltransferase n=1 Tax=Snodgrassella TaxID=1193515 RepID=UPI0018DD12B7|nr:MULTISPECIES: 5-methyltetrahydropteroyltriglutamate--homocysteine S-methyltransferase [unclassified Snodgrassella]MBI0068372.1 5-methyltetrahydropteroyltriglutamate--homocysteine S-methyltransferase [Snodgrassella sp. M0110]MBI0077702.1 5-methyltetrahydropteroyltriglutamate--homocysteine S-methyltransferase [Snodgrassella sp. M0118]MBI0079673.1 5-methyltetrahydropteroyltriglutamate--homocysteine S-methyltransferase [Snodgrassella sp. M0112]MBI0097839.1 5-methyltetrahydropteroyltriglutamate--